MLRKSRRCKRQYKFWFVSRPFRKIEKWVVFVWGLCRFLSKSPLPMSRRCRLRFLSVCRNRRCKSA